MSVLLTHKKIESNSGQESGYLLLNGCFRVDDISQPFFETCTAYCSEGLGAYNSGCYDSIYREGSG